MIYGEEDFDKELIRMIKTSHEEGKEYRHSCYRECVEHAEEMSWHLYGVTPAELLQRARPREDPEVTQYRLDNYEPTTKSAADKAINIVSKIFNPQLYSIRWKTESESGSKLKSYTLEYYPDYNSIVNFTKDVLLRKMLADPNGVAAVKLKTIPDQSNELPEPVLCLYGSANIWNFDDDHYLIFIEKEEIRSKNGNPITWYYFEYYDKSEYICFRAYLTSTNRLIVEIEERYPYNFDEIPVWRLQGVPEAKDNGHVIYKSFFNSAVPYWNYAIIHESDLIGAYINHIHPIMYEIIENCNYVHANRFPCKRGVITTETGDKITCPECSGTGSRSLGPYGVKRISKEKLLEGETPSGMLPIGYVPVPTEATAMLEQRSDNMRRMGMWAINMDIEDEIGENQSGVAKVIDRAAQYDTLYNIGSVVFDVHLQNTYHFFNKFMFGVESKSTGQKEEANLPEINKPTKFDIGTTAEMLETFKLAKESGADPNYLQIKQQEMVTRDLTTNPDLKKFAFLLLDLDPLPGMSPADVSLNLSKLIIRQVDAVIHFNLKRFLEKAIEENKNFTDLPRKEQVETLEKYSEEMIEANKPKIDPNILAYAQEQKKKAAQGAFA